MVMKCALEAAGGFIGLGHQATYAQTSTNDRAHKAAVKSTEEDKEKGKE